MFLIAGLDINLSKPPLAIIDCALSHKLARSLGPKTWTHICMMAGLLIRPARSGIPPAPPPPPMLPIKPANALISGIPPPGAAPAPAPPGATSVSSSLSSSLAPVSLALTVACARACFMLALDGSRERPLV